MIMRAMSRQISVLALGAALLGALPQGAAAQQAGRASSPVPGLGNATVTEGIAPDLLGNNQATVTTASDGSAREVVGQDEQTLAANPYGAQAYDADVTYTQANGQRAGLRHETPADRAGRYYGAAYSNNDMTAAAFADDDMNSTHGKTTMKARRLGVFDQGSVDSRTLSIKPYIEAQQVVQATNAPGNDVLTYSVLAAGGDITLNGRNNQGEISARYERRIGWNHKSDSDGVTGIARLSTSVVPDALRMDYGAYANRTYVSGMGSAFNSGAVNSDSLTQIYSAYAGPTLATQVGDAVVTGHYHAGYTSVGSTGTVTTPGIVGNTDTLDHSTVQDAKLAVGTRAGEVLPVGLGVDAGFYQEDVSNLSQRVNDKHVRGEITIPVAEGLAVVGGAGYEHVQISSRDALRDSTGAAVRDAKGRLITDMSQPRVIAYSTEGLIWDAGVVWRPSSRTNLEAHVGERYGQLGGYGFFNFQPNEHSNFNLMVYEGITGFGGTLTNSLFNLPTQFTTIRDAISGNLSSCVSSLAAGSCLGGSLTSVNSTVYRGRGVSLGYALELGRTRAGLGMGYDRRQYITAPGTVLASLNGVVDQYYWVSAFLGYSLTPHSTLEGSLDAYKYQSGLNSAGSVNALRAVGLYQYYLSRHLTANASLALDGITRVSLDDLWGATGSLGMRYTF